jgi:NTE family protein
MTTAFVLSGGASLGAVQVGMLQALTERQVTPDLLVGTSAGAVNAAYVAAHGTGRVALGQLADIWAGLRREHVFPLGPRRVLAALAGRRDSLCSDESLRRLVGRYLTFTELEHAEIPLHIVTTDLLSGDEVLLSAGDAVSAVLASTAVPGILPPVRRENLTLVDGGLADNAAISQAVKLGADTIYVLPTGYACALSAPPASPLSVALQALSLLIQQRLIVDVAHYAERVELIVLPPLCPLAVSPIDFSHAVELVRRAHGTSGDWLDSGATSRPHPERVLSLHRHGTGRRVASRNGSGVRGLEGSGPVSA